MIKNIVATFVKYPFYANLIIAVLLLGGGYGIMSMKKSFFPEMSTTDIVVSVVYPGASPKEMEEGVTMRIEESIRGIVGIKWVTSTSSENFASVTITTTGDYDIDETLMEVKNAVDGITSFPVDAERPIVYKVRRTTNALFMSLVGDVDLLTLKKYADEVELDLYNSGVMSQINISGYPALEISVEASEEDLLRHNLTFGEISRAIALNNRDISAGMIRSDEEEILIRSRAKTYDPDEIGNIILRADPDGRFLRIRDVATLKKQFSEEPSGAFMNGQPSISFQITKLAEEDLSEITAFMKDYIADFNARHEKVKLEITYNFLDMLGDRLNLLYRNGGAGLLLVLIALGLFLNLRLSFWVAFGIPASFLAMFIVAPIYGITINMFSLFGMILVIGILVDDGIVIAENIYTHYQRGKSPRRAAVEGTMEVLPAVTTSVVTTIIAFSPILFLEGRMEMMFEMAFVVIFSLFFSLFEAFFVLPAHVGSKFVLRKTEKKSRWMSIRRSLDGVMDFMKHRMYAPTLRFMLKWKYVMITTPVALIMITAGLFQGGQIQSTFFPAIPFDFFNVNLAFTPGSGEKQTYEYLQSFEDAMWELNEEIKEEYDYPEGVLNYTFISLGNSFNGREIGAHAGNIFVLLRNLEDAPVSSFEIVEKLRQKIGPVPEAEKFTVEGLATFGIPVSISLLGKNLDELYAAKEFMMEEMGNIKILKDINDNNAIGKREVQLELKPKAYFLGLTHNEISNQVREGFYGGQAQRLQIGKDEVRVWVRYPREDRLNLGQMENMKIKTPMGDYPLSELADYEIRRGPVNIQHYNMSREVRIDANLVDPFAPVPPILEEIRTQIVPRMQQMYPGIEVEYQGQQRDSDEAMADLSKYFGIAFMIIILLIMVHFKSFTQGSMILIMIPLGWLGAMWGHGLEGYPVSMLSAWGMVALSGVIINDAVVFLSKYNSLVLEGRTVIDAVYEAGLARFRAIVLTTITTTLGLYPIIMESSFQAQFLIPMAISLAYGVMFGTAFILVLLPVIILVLSDIRMAVNKLWTGKTKTAEELEPANIHAKRVVD
ncbi:MAG: efflux RND transporter permease subunit [Bacteroidales bacterium]|jgi:multidrug efflux pump subunit AcrB|nr:efflux RND transporter permease subunit [Bacteroidales bacterium]